MIRDEVERIEADRRARALNIAAAPVVAAAAIAWFAVWRRWGKEPTRSADIGDYWREVPEESPAVVAAIDDWGVISPSAFASTVIDLAQRGWLTVTEEPGGHRFTRTQQTTDELRCATTSRRCSGGCSPVEGGHTQDELVDEAKDDRTASATWMQSFKAQVRADYDAQQGTRSAPAAAVARSMS